MTDEVPTSRPLQQRGNQLDGWSRLILDSDQNRRRDETSAKIEVQPNGLRVIECQIE
jgi:hypothetical protein